MKTFYDKWNRKTLEYLGRVEMEEEGEFDKEFTFEEVRAPNYPSENLEPGFYKILYDNTTIYIAEKKDDSGYYKDYAYDINGRTIYHPDIPGRDLKFTSGLVKILKRMNVEEI